MTSPHALATAFVAEQLVDWIPPHGPVMVGDVRTTATGVLVRALAALIEREREQSGLQARLGHETLENRGA